MGVSYPEPARRLTPCRFPMRLAVFLALLLATAAFLALLLAVAVPAPAQPAASPAAPSHATAPDAPRTPARLSAAAEVSLVTALPGAEVWQLFGHTFFRVRDPLTGLDRTYNYGTFDFEQSNFVLRFARGQLDYALTTPTFEQTRWSYRAEGRALIEQRLALSADEAQRLYALLETNALPAYREYRYDFFFDNCSTRPFDLLALALERPIALPPSPARRTFRDLIQPYLEVHPLTDFAIDLALGLPTDREATPREETFLPLELMRALDGATARGRPLVAQTDTLFWFPPPTAAPPAFDWPLALGWALFALGLAATTRDVRRGRAGWARTDGLLFWTAGLAGVVILLLWTATEHRTTGPNLNLLWAWPTHVLLGAALARGGRARWTGPYCWTAGLFTALAVLTWPLGPQALPAPALPLALLLALRMLTRARLGARREITGTAVLSQPA